MAVRIFLATSSVLMSAIKRSGGWHFWQTVSIPKTTRRSSDHRMYFGAFLGLSCPGSGAAAGVGTTWLREALCDESTRKYRTGRGEARDFAGAVEHEGAGQHAFGEDGVGRQDRGHARAYRPIADHQRAFPLDEGGVAPADARHVGDGIARTGGYVADGEAQLTKARTHGGTRGLGCLGNDRRGLFHRGQFPFDETSSSPMVTT